MKKRFLQQSFYPELPDDWKQNLSEDLRKWKQKKDRRQIGRLRAILQRLNTIVENNRRRVKRLEAIRGNMDLPDTFAPTIQRYKESKNTFLQKLDRLNSALEDVDTSTFRETSYPDPVLKGMINILDPLTMMSLQYRRFSALSSGPASLIYAEQVLRDAERIDPGNPNVFYYLGRVYERLGLETISSRNYLMALREDPDYHRRDQIVTMFETVLDNNPNDPRAHYDVAYAYYETGKKSQSLRHLLRVIEHECSLGRLQGIEKAYENGKTDRALALVDAVVNQKCNDKSMVQVLAHKRIEYILKGEPPYYRLADY